MQLLLTILLIGLLTYETTSLAGYLFQLLVLCRCGEFSNAYYGIVRYSAVMDLFIFFSDWLTRRSLSLPVLEPLMRRLYSLFPHANIALVVQTFCFHVLMAPAIFSAVQSICILASPIIADVVSPSPPRSLAPIPGHFQKFRAVVPKFFGLVVVYGLALSLPLFATHPDLVETADRLFFHWESIQESSLTLLINFFIAIGYLVIMIVLIFIFGFYLHEYWKERLVRLCLLSFFICVSRTFVLVLMTCNFLNTHLSLGWEPVLDPLLTVSLDITLLASPWLHFAFNRAFQRRVAWILGIKTENRIHVTNTVTQQQNPSASMYKY